MNAVYLSTMGGTGLAILSPHDGDSIAPVVVEELLAEGMIQSQSDPDYWYFTDELPYGYEILSETPDPEQWRVVEQAAGITIRSEVILQIFVSALAGRPALGRMAQRVAQRIDGWVFVEFSRPPTCELLAHLARAGRSLPADRDVYLDAAAMAAWLVHPDFHVLK